jgi:signal peptidase S26 family
LLLAVNGTELFGNLDLPSALDNGHRQPLSEPLALGGRGPVSLGVRGLDAKVSHLRLFRDIHYSGRNGKTVYPNAITKAVELRPGEYFMLGDNSTNSYDSRCWKDPVIREEYMVGKAFLVHMPTRLLEWRQFGEKRALAVPDWSRMKLLR